MMKRWVRQSLARVFRRDLDKLIVKIDRLIDISRLKSQSAQTSEGFLKPCLQYGNGTDVREMLRNGADDSLIEEKMREAVFFKPDGHEFGRSGKGEEIETKKMSQIGG